jgi:DNA-binding MarR family transcriptional regulator
MSAVRSEIHSKILRDLREAPAWARSYQHAKGVISDLIDAGLVERCRPIGGRGRNMVRLTDTGEALLEAAEMSRSGGCAPREEFAFRQHERAMEGGSDELAKALKRYAAEVRLERQAIAPTSARRMPGYRVRAAFDSRPPAFNREPCPHCGTRGDLGCAHFAPCEQVTA